MRILFVLENFYPKIGGVETFFMLLIRQLSAQGIRVKVLTSGAKNVPRIEQLDQNITIYRLKSESRYHFTFLSVGAIMKLARDVDLIHTTSYNAGLPAWVAAKLTKKKVIITFHEYWGKLWFSLPFESGLNKRLYYWFERILVNLSFDRFVAVSKYTQQSLLAKLPEAQIAMIYNGLDYREFSYEWTGQDSKRILFYGRLGISKGLDMLIEAIAKIDNLNGYQFELILSEKQSHYYRHLVDLINTHSLQSDVLLVDTMPWQQLKQHIAQSYAVIIPSISEGFCFVAAESVALGVPIISSGKGALSEVVTGKHITFGEYSVEGCRQAIQRAVEQQWHLTEVKRFKIESTTQAYVELYNEVIN